MKKYSHKNAEKIWREVDSSQEVSYWAILKPGLVIDDCKGVSENTLKKLMVRLNDATRGEAK